MKHLFCLIGFLALLTTVAVGQHKWAISATATPLYEQANYRRLYLYPDSDGQIVEPVFLSGKRSAWGYEAGLTLRYTYAPGWSVGTGVWYRQLTLRQGRPVDAGEGTTAVRSRAVRVPLLLNYQYSTKRLSPYFSAGVLLDFSMASRVVVTRDGESTQRLRLGTSLGPVFHALLGAGAQYRVNSRYSFIVQPVGTYNLGRFGGSYDNNPAYELSLLTQVVYTF